MANDTTLETDEPRRPWLLRLAKLVAGVIIVGVVFAGVVIGVGFLLGGLRDDVIEFDPGTTMVPTVTNDPTATDDPTLGPEPLPSPRSRRR